MSRTKDHLYSRSIVESLMVVVTASGKKGGQSPLCASMYNKETRKWEFEKYDHLQDAVKRFFEILDIKEVSSFGREFHPNKMNLEDRKINSCRVYNSAELESVLEQMKILSGYRQQKEMQDWKI